MPSTSGEQGQFGVVAPLGTGLAVTVTRQEGTEEQRRQSREEGEHGGCPLLPFPCTCGQADAFLGRGEGVIGRWGSVGPFFHL